MNQGKNKRHSPVSMTVDCVGASATSGIALGGPKYFLPIVASNKRLRWAKWFCLSPGGTRCLRGWCADGNSLVFSISLLSKP